MKSSINILEAQDIKEILGMALTNVYKLMKRPDFPAILISDRRWIVPEKAFEKWLEDQIEHKKMGNICLNCGNVFKPDHHRNKYCPECVRMVRAKQNRDRVRRCRERKQINDSD